MAKLGSTPSICSARSVQHRRTLESNVEEGCDRCVMWLSRLQLLQSQQRIVFFWWMLPSFNLRHFETFIHQHGPHCLCPGQRMFFHVFFSVRVKYIYIYNNLNIYIYIIIIYIYTYTYIACVYTCGWTKT